MGQSICVGATKEKAADSVGFEALVVGKLQFLIHGRVAPRSVITLDIICSGFEVRNLQQAPKVLQRYARCVASSSSYLLKQHVPWLFRDVGKWRACCFACAPLATG